MASPYQAYTSRQPASNIPYANINASPTYPYPPQSRYDASAASLDSDSSGGHDQHKGGGPKSGPATVDFRAVNRTPSPTPSEAKELAKSGIFDWGAMLKWKYWFRKEWIWYYVAFTIGLVVTILFTVYHEQIVNWLMPAANWMHNLHFGWLIPIGILFVISFPPLFGHEIVAILCGLVWGLWLGFAIVAAGTFIGELGNFYAFKHCCAARGEKLEKTKISYACLARVVREGGFKIALIARLSAIPGHFTTAVFSTCGMGVWTFSLAAVLSLPKQFITVYLGVVLEQSEKGSSSKSDTIVKDIVLGVTTLITVGAMWYIYHKMNQAKPFVIYDRRKARQAKLAMSATPSLPYGNPAMLESTTSVAFNASDTDIPLSKYSQPSQNVYAPQPRRPQQPPSTDGYPMSEREYTYGSGPAYGYGAQAPSLPPGAGYAYPGPPPSQSQAQSQRQPPRRISPPADPFSDTARVPYAQQQQGVSYQRQAPQRGYGSPPPGTFSGRQPSVPALASPPPPAVRPPALPTTSAPQTPTQRTYPPSAKLPPPPAEPEPANPFSDPMPNPYEASHEHAYDDAYEDAYAHGAHVVEPSDATFYTAAGGHSRSATRESFESEGSSSTEHGAGLVGSGPPSYHSLPS